MILGLFANWWAQDYLLISLFLHDMIIYMALNCIQTLSENKHCVWKIFHIQLELFPFLSAGWCEWCSSIQTLALVELSDWWSMLPSLWSLRDVAFRSGQPITTQHTASLRPWTLTYLWHVNLTFTLLHHVIPQKIFSFNCFSCFSYRCVWVTGYPPACLATCMLCVPTWGWSMWPSTWSSWAGWSTMSSSVIKWVVWNRNWLPVCLVITHLTSSEASDCLGYSESRFHCPQLPVNLHCHTL